MSSSRSTSITFQKSLQIGSINPVSGGYDTANRNQFSAARKLQSQLSSFSGTTDNRKLRLNGKYFNATVVFSVLEERLGYKKEGAQIRRRWFKQCKLRRACQFYSDPKSKQSNRYWLCLLTIIYAASIRWYFPLSITERRDVQFLFRDLVFHRMMKK